MQTPTPQPPVSEVVTYVSANDPWLSYLTLAVAALSLIGTFWVSRQQRKYTNQTWIKEQRRGAYREFQAAYSHTLRALDKYNAEKSTPAFDDFVTTDERHFLAVADVRVIGSLSAKKILRLYNRHLRQAFDTAGTDAYEESRDELAATLAVLTVQMWVDLGVYQTYSPAMDKEVDRRIELNRQAFLKTDTPQAEMGG